MNFLINKLYTGTKLERFDPRVHVLNTKTINKKLSIKLYKKVNKDFPRSNNSTNTAPTHSSLVPD